MIEYGALILVFVTILLVLAAVVRSGVPHATEVGAVIMGFTILIVGVFTVSVGFGLFSSLWRFYTHIPLLWNSQVVVIVGGSVVTIFAAWVAYRSTGAKRATIIVILLGLVIVGLEAFPIYYRGY